MQPTWICRLQIFTSNFAMPLGFHWLLYWKPLRSHMYYIEHVFIKIQSVKVFLSISIEIREKPCQFLSWYFIILSVSWNFPQQYWNVRPLLKWTILLLRFVCLLACLPTSDLLLWFLSLYLCIFRVWIPNISTNYYFSFDNYGASVLCTSFLEAAFVARERCYVMFNVISVLLLFQFFFWSFSLANCLCAHFLFLLSTFIVMFFSCYFW